MISQKLLTLVNAHLRATGESARRLSLRVFGHDGAVNALRRGQAPSINNARMLCEAIGVDFRFVLPEELTPPAAGSDGSDGNEAVTKSRQRDEMPAISREALKIAELFDALTPEAREETMQAALKLLESAQARRDAEADGGAQAPDQRQKA